MTDKKGKSLAKLKEFQRCRVHFGTGKKKRVVVGDLQATDPKTKSVTVFVPRNGNPGNEQITVPANTIELLK